MTRKNDCLLVIEKMLMLLVLSCIMRKGISRRYFPKFALPGKFRGGAQFRNVSQTLQDYVTAMEEKDAGRDDITVIKVSDADGSSSPNESSSKSTQGSRGDIVGVKSKKSNAVGDPDDDSDDSDDDEDDLSEWEEHHLDDEHQQSLQVEVELVEPDVEQHSHSTTRGSGGVGVRLGRRRRNRKKKATASTIPLVVNTWLPHLYLPPTARAIAHMKENTRSLDTAGKTRLDRRTLYGGLLLEFTSSTGSTRKYFSKDTYQQLQAALSLATQPQWRSTFPQTSGIMLYDIDDDNGGATLSMQETIAMALAHSLGCGFVVLDDFVLSMIRQQLIQQGVEDVNPASLIETLLTMAKDGQLTSSSCTPASIAQDMESELSTSLMEDPYDDRALRSCEEMGKWEAEWRKEQLPKTEKAIPIVLFLRTSSSNSILKSKSAIDYLMQEFTSSESIHLLILGKGIDSTTSSLPPEPVTESASMHGNSFDNPSIMGMPQDGAAPWFGLSPQTQNASGQNDPEGSRRFNIFIARIYDSSGQPGIWGAIAPPQAGNLFPHIMAMQAKERLDNFEGPGDDAPIKAELERWAEMISKQMQENNDNSFPPPQFFNASLAAFGSGSNNKPGQQNVPPEVVQQALEQALSELLDRQAQLEGEGDDMQKAFSQLLKNENLRRSIAENLSRATPTLADPQCQGVMLSVYVPPMNRPKPGWFQKILDNGGTDKKKRVRTMAAAAAMVAASKGTDSGNESSSQGGKPDITERNLSKLESICRSVVIDTPSDPVRAKAWDGWISREKGAVLFRQNRNTLQEELSARSLTLTQTTGAHGAGSVLRQMLSVRDLSDEMEDVVKCAVELEAAQSQKRVTSSATRSMDIDVTLSQLLLTDDGILEESKIGEEQFIHPSNLETALSLTCRISPSPGGGMWLKASPASHRSREEVMALAQDKHERALVSQVVSPQDIGVTYDMVGGLTDVKELLRQSITYPLKFPHLYSEGIAREAVKGVLLFGPPGTGKTMLAKAVATEGGASFLSVDASSVENKWLGESEKNAKAVFTLARRLAPCVIFIDEVDSLLSSREGSSDDSAHGTLTSVKTTMMSEWDGLNSGTNGYAGSDRVIVIGSTNRPFDLDEAVLRRFPRRILVDLPDLETRAEILEVTLAENRLDPNVNLTKIAERLEGYTGSDIKEVCREAVVQISHEQAKLLDEGFGASGPTAGALKRLRPVRLEDFEKALGKLKRSVSESGRELARVWEWNDEYGEIKKEKKGHQSQLMNMYL